MKRNALLLFLVISCFTFTSTAQKESRLFNFPTIHNNHIAFSYGGDIYIVDSNGGIARKLTSHKGYEMFPRFSPDGKHIAFTGQYDGNTEVFVIPAIGGTPKRLSYTATIGRDDLGDRMGPNNIVMGWTPDGKHITIRSRRYTFNSFTGQLFNIPVNGGLCKEITLKDGGFCSWSPDGKKLAYNYIFREFRTWKRYKGGMADDIRIFDTETKKSEKITDNISQDIIPMWAENGKEIFYLSERDEYMNLYVYNIENKQTKQLTYFKDYDIKFPSIGKKYLVFSKGGYIYKLNIDTKKFEKVSITIANDNIYSRPVLKDVKKNISALTLSPNGERIAVAARGDIFTIPAKEGITYNLNNSCDANDKNCSWSPDGKHIAYISDKSGEFQIYLHKVNSQEKDIQLTSKFKTYIFDIKWAPDSKSILWNDKMNRLNITDIKSKATKTIEQSPISPIHSYNWSPDSKWITYTRPEKTMSKVMLYNTESNDKYPVTKGWYDSSSANFSACGKFLIFSSGRTFSPIYSHTEWNHAYNNMEKLYLVTLSKNTPSPFVLKNDMVKTEEKEKKTENKNGNKPPKKKDSKKEKTNIDIDGIQDRIIEIPVTASNYYGLHLIKDKVYYKRWGKKSGSYFFDLKTKKETALGVDIIFGAGYKKAVAKKNSSIEVINIPIAKVSIKKPINLDGLRKELDYHKEWMQIYNESWRQMRDFFYSPKLHGVDWNKVYTKYKALIPYVNHRTDLTLVIGEMIGELNVGHAYSANGEHPMPARIKMGLLGAKFIKDGSGFFKISKILKGTNWRTKTVSPLKAIGINVKEGDYILAINGKTLKKSANIYEHLINTAGKEVELTVNNKASFEGSRKVLVMPISDEGPLYYYNWVQNNIDKVNKATNGKVGYIHIPDMGPDGLNEFVKHYYPQLTKKALIIDDRGNGGGNVSPMITERLKRTATFFTMHTNQKEGSVNPVGTFLGPKVLLVNQYSASDGDLFPYRFKYNKLGKVIGKRTWGGVVGYSGYIKVVDGGHIVTPSYAPYAADGSEFIIEGRGVTPHIDIDNDPYKEYMGEDQQLNKAIEVILEELKTKRKTIPSIPLFPNKSPKKK